MNIRYMCYDNNTLIYGAPYRYSGDSNRCSSPVNKSINMVYALSFKAS